jgi:hypothetical protein
MKVIARTANPPPFLVLIPNRDDISHIEEVLGETKGKGAVSIRVEGELLLLYGDHGTMYINLWGVK